MSTSDARLLVGDCRTRLRELPAGAAQCCVTSPPYWGLRDYGHELQIGNERTPQEYVDALVEVFREVRRVLSDDGTLWLNLGDSYANDGKWGGSSGGKHAQGLHGKTSVGRARRETGLKSKDMVGIPWRVAFALQADGWWLRSDIIWSKPNAMPEPVTDRPTKAHEYVFLLAKSEVYFYDADAVREPFANGIDGATPRGKNDRELNRGGRKDGLGTGTGTGWTPSAGGRNSRSVWSICTEPYRGAHFATMPPELAQRCILAGSRLGDMVVDPFFGSGTTGEVAEALGRRWLGCELNADYVGLAAERTAQAGLPFAFERSR